MIRSHSAELADSLDSWAAWEVPMPPEPGAHLVASLEGADYLRWAFTEASHCDAAPSRSDGVRQASSNEIRVAPNPSHRVLCVWVHGAYVARAGSSIVTLSVRLDPDFPLPRHERGWTVETKWQPRNVKFVKKHRVPLLVGVGGWPVVAGQPLSSEVTVLQGESVEIHAIHTADYSGTGHAHTAHLFDAPAGASLTLRGESAEACWEYVYGARRRCPGVSGLGVLLVEGAEEVGVKPGTWIADRPESAQVRLAIPAAMSGASFRLLAPADRFDPGDVIRLEFTLSPGGAPWRYSGGETCGGTAGRPKYSCAVVTVTVTGEAQKSKPPVAKVETKPPTPRPAQADDGAELAAQVDNALTADPNEDCSGKALAVRIHKALMDTDNKKLWEDRVTAYTDAGC